MGIRLKRPKQVGPPPPTKLRALSDGDLYLYVESGLMHAQQLLSEYRQGDFLTRGALLDRLEEGVRSVALGVEEMQSRSV